MRTSNRLELEAVRPQWALAPEVRTEQTDLACGAMGDPACFLAETCLDCGRFVEGAADDICPHCGADLSGSGDHAALRP